MRAKILNGRWTRNVTWEQKGIWSTDIFKTTLPNPSKYTSKWLRHELSHTPIY